MIFVTVGTTDFDALVEHMDVLAPTLGQDVLCQTGAGSYTPTHCEYFRFAPSLDDYLRRADPVVSHGGLASVIEVARLGKPLIGVSNPDRRDRHQDDILGRFEADHHLVWCRLLADLGMAIERAGHTSFAPYMPPECAIHQVIGAFLERQSANHQRRWPNT